MKKQLTFDVKWKVQLLFLFSLVLFCFAHLETKGLVIQTT